MEGLDMEVRERALSAHKRREIAVRAHVDPRSVDRVLRGEPLRESVKERVLEALARDRARPREHAAERRPR
jgi:DNA-binding LacI/PurR family transcriptional regulator